MPSRLPPSPARNPENGPKSFISFNFSCVLDPTRDPASALHTKKLDVISFNFFSKRKCAHKADGNNGTSAFAAFLRLTLGDYYATGNIGARALPKSREHQGQVQAVRRLEQHARARPHTKCIPNMDAKLVEWAPFHMVRMLEWLAWFNAAGNKLAEGERAHRRLVRQSCRHRADARGQGACVGRRQLHASPAQGKGLRHKARRTLRRVYDREPPRARQAARENSFHQDAQCRVRRRRAAPELHRIRATSTCFGEFSEFGV